MTVVVSQVQPSSLEGRSAMNAAVAEALARRSRLIIVNANELPDEVITDFQANNLEYELSPIEGGDSIASAMVRVAQQANADLIVIALRRRSPVGKLLLGSGAQQILLEAPCPVLAVKAEKIAA